MSVHEMRRRMLASFLEVEDSVCNTDDDLAADLAWYTHHGLDKYLFAQRPDVIRHVSGSFLNQIHRDRARALFLWAELERLLEEATRSGLQLVPLKGLALAERIWGGFPRRPVEDLDLYSPVDQVEAATMLLVESGYQEHKVLASSQRPLYRRFEHEAQFFHSRTHHLVELHWNLSYGFKPLSWRLEEQPSLKRWRLAPEDELLFLILHGTKHRWSRLKWLLDIALFCQKLRIDWELFQERVLIAQAERPVEITFVLLSALFGEQGKLCERSLSPTLRNQAIILAHSLLTDATSVSRPFRDHLRYQLDLRSSWRARFDYIVDLLFKPTRADLESFLLPRKLHYFYYLLRPPRLLRQYGVTFLWNKH